MKGECEVRERGDREKGGLARMSEWEEGEERREGEDLSNSFVDFSKPEFSGSIIQCSQ